MMWVFSSQLTALKTEQEKEVVFTRSLVFKRGSLVRHKRYGLCYVGGSSKGRISVHSLSSGKRLSQSVKIDDCVFRSYLRERSV